MHRLQELLKGHPLLGMLGSVMGAMQAFMRTSTPILQYIALLLGVAIGLLTLAIKVKELRQAKRQ